MDHFEWWTGDKVLYHGIPAVVVGISYNMYGCVVHIQDGEGTEYCVPDTMLKMQEVK